MDVQTVVANALTLNTNNMMNLALQGLSDADLLKRPSDQCNPMGWLLWHQARAEDAIVPPPSSPSCPSPATRPVRALRRGPVACRLHPVLASR